MHKSYQDKYGHVADFRVAYRFYTAKEGGRNTIPYQGYRSDFFYEHPQHSRTSKVFMIWPEFENEFGEIILDDSTPVLQSGFARMWVVDKKARTYHSDKIQVGLTGYFMEGSRRVAECKVVEFMGLTGNLK